MSVPMLRVLFTSAGRRVELTRCFRRAGKVLDVDIEVHACDLTPHLSAACLDADVSFAVPRCTTPDYVPRLLEYCRANGIDLLVPTIDTELEALAASREDFAAAGTLVHVSAPETIAIVRDKARTTEVLERAGVPVPRTAPIEAVRAAPDEWSWPLFAKPVGGSASRGIGVLEGPGDICALYDEPMLVQDLLEGPEYTINMYLDGEGHMLCAIPHERLSVRAGEVEKGRTLRDSRMIEIAEAIARTLPGAQGALCFQLIDDPCHGLRVFEINARFGGGYPLADHAGGRFAENLLRRVLGRAPVDPSDWRAGVTMVRYDAAHFLG
ncbi:ATP-grasp domain-containing protein [Novosphingobium mangrovi (ex Hu et al. 2023)]|uniref:ATP-grasp domain-containing protein n=1 Tax=Novosphingobium mangrovi (ex Hu et al. 2023) TaxID=2930094 RepID=A0ABT0AC08_9SPHN|nr:ATP-grasp domain-containing protein [Novosphingobium mangrovi (ex Hu et al. 2023)]MCJ1960709.1 ATP-grasp domain-containing protein [Novosphingobium mangrovi (ex Hu et al. 2023)]